MQIRLIIASRENGENETVTFTDDVDSPAADFVTSDQTVNFDGVIEADIPDRFPIGSTLYRGH